MTRKRRPRFVGMREACELSGYSRTQMLRYSATDPILVAGRIKGRGRSGKVRIDEDAFNRWIDSQRAIQAPVGASHA